MTDEKFILVTHSRIGTFISLRFYKVNTKEQTASDVTDIIAAVPEYVRVFSNGAVVARKGAVYSIAEHGWRSGTLRLFQREVMPNDEAPEEKTDIQKLFDTAMEKTPNMNKAVAELASLPVIIVNS
jgi:hypothetical protein